MYNLPKVIVNHQSSLLFCYFTSKGICFIETYFLEFSDVSTVAYNTDVLYSSFN